MTLPSNSTLLAQQKANYQSVIQACNAVEKCIGVTVWDFTDKVRFLQCTTICTLNKNPSISTLGECLVERVY